ncbi:MAG: PEP-utilizing enzyme [Patescibacteria group bacterium]|jgi:phosphohistidine swiveling domain-containing protein
MNDQKVVLEKTFSRKYNLFGGYMWYQADCVQNEYILGFDLNHSLTIFPKEGPTTCWYYTDEIAHAIELIVAKSNSDPLFWENVKKDFYFYWNKILPYLKKDKTIQNLEELKNYYSTAIKFYGPDSIVIVSPGAAALGDNFKEIAQSLRNESHYFVNNVPDVYADYFCSAYPQYKKIVDVLLPEEVFNIDKITPEIIAEAEKRAQEGCFLLNGRPYCLSELNQVLATNGYELKDPSQISEADQRSSLAIKGVVAHPGIVTGRVSKVMYYQDIGKVKEGDILVSPMTMPKFLPAMRKAAAFITDEGGITCHAAIIARELSKPCIIGTKVATSLLEDGDLVKVDAVKGEVIIIEKTHVEIS